MQLPDLKYPDRDFGGWRPTWSGYGEYISDAHRSVWQETSGIEGWQAEGDSLKLFELAYFCGDVILEIGVFGGRSATVELLGALSNPERRIVPQYYGIDIAPDAIIRASGTLAKNSLNQHSMLFLGDLEQFVKTMGARPTMVFVDGDHYYDGAKKDLAILSHILPGGVPVLCHDYRNGQNLTGELGVQRACHEWEQEGYATFWGTFGASALYFTTANCHGASVPRAAEEFRMLQHELNDVYSFHLKDVRVRPFAECQ